LVAASLCAHTAAPRQQAPHIPPRTEVVQVRQAHAAGDRELEEQQPKGERAQHLLRRQAAQLQRRRLRLSSGGSQRVWPRAASCLPARPQRARQQRRALVPAVLGQVQPLLPSPAARAAVPAAAAACRGRCCCRLHGRRAC
jgi:hypothetical protein